MQCKGTNELFLFLIKVHIYIICFNYSCGPKFLFRLLCCALKTKHVTVLDFDHTKKSLHHVNIAVVLDQK